MTTENSESVGDADGKQRRTKRLFDPWRLHITPAGQEFVNEVATVIEVHEEKARLRERKRRPGIKKVTSSFLFVDAPLSRFPKETRALFKKTPGQISFPFALRG